MSSMKSTALYECICHFPSLSSSRFSHNIKIIHFIGAMKPWQHKYLPEVDAVILEPGSYASQNAAQDYLKRWWQVYTSLQQVGNP